MAKGAYIGVPAEVPVYEEQTATITESNLSEFFDAVATTGSGFVGSNGVFSSATTVSQSSVVQSQSTWTAKKNISNLSLNYAVGNDGRTTKANFVITVAGVDVVTNSAGATGNWSGAIKEGESIVFYSMNASTASSLSSIVVTAQVQTGTETKDVARKVKSGYVGVPKAEYEPVFADNSWAQVIKACQKNEVPSTWAVGDSKTMNIGGTDYQIDIIGKNHDIYSDGSGIAPLTFQMHDSYATSYAMNSSNTNSGGWESTAIRTTRLPAILALMPSEVQAGIKEVNKLTGQGGTSSAVETTADKLFILSVNEIFGFEPSNVAKGEGTQYAYYADGNSTQKKQNGEYNYWWTRSPVSTNSSGFFQVRTDGDRVSTNYPSGTYGVAFAFCFGGTSEVDSVLGGYSVARKIKKAYIGIGGVARPCWSGGKITLYGEITSLPQATRGHASASIGNYAMFAGGYSNSSRACSGNVYTYDSSLTVSTLSNGLDQARTGMAATTVYRSSHDDFVAFFGGGIQWTGYYSVVDCYDGACTKVSHGNNLTRSRQGLSAKTVGNYGVFAGGKDPNGYVDIVDAFNPDSSQTLAPNLSKMRGGMGSASIGGYALFAGGSDGTGGSSGYFDTVDAYDSSLTRTSPTALSVSRGSLRSAVVGDFALFAGGSYEDGLNNNYISTVVDIYNSSLTRTTATDLSVQRSGMSSASMGEFAIFVGGEVNGASVTTVDIYDSSLTRTVADLPYAQHGMGSATAGQYTIFAGGTISNGNQSNATEKAIAYIVI